MKSKPQEEIAENEQEMAAAVINAAKKTLISQVVKRNVIENIVPIVISLKHKVRAGVVFWNVPVREIIVVGGKGECVCCLFGSLVGFRLCLCRKA